jgi:hypothetical protein
MFRQSASQFAIAAFGVMMTAGLAVAQYGSRVPTSVEDIQRQAVGRGYSVGSVNKIALRNAQGYLPSGSSLGKRSYGPSNLGLSPGPASKPFSTYTPPPTTSPYLNLFREDLEGGSDFNYQTLVRPMLQQQAINEQLQRQTIETARRLQAVAAQADFNPQGSQSQYPTGHKTVFNYYGHYYTMPRQRR